MEYPTYIEVPEDYWTMTTTADIDLTYNPNLHWHSADDESK